MYETTEHSYSQQKQGKSPVCVNRRTCVQYSGQSNVTQAILFHELTKFIFHVTKLEPCCWHHKPARDVWGAGRYFTPVHGLFTLLGPQRLGWLSACVV